MSKDYIESDILLAMITSTQFLTYVKDPLQVAFQNYGNDDFIKSKEIEKIMQWILQYYDAYGEAPQKNMQSFVEPKLQRIKKQDKNQYKLIYSLLASLSEYALNMEEQEINAGAQWDTARQYFNKRRREILSEYLKASADNDDESLGEDALQKYMKTESTTSKIEGTYSNINQITMGLQQREDPILRFPGALGRMMNPHMIPGGFVSFLGSEKRGKSWWLLYAMAMAAKRRIPTVMFQAGDMSTQDVLVRLAVLTAKRSNDSRYCGLIHVPVLDCGKCQRGECTGEPLVWPGKDSGGDKKSRKKKQTNGNGSNGNDESEYKLNIGELLKLNKNYEPCSDCLKDQKKKHLYEGAVYWKERPQCAPLTAADVQTINKEYMSRFHITAQNEPNIITYSAGELNMTKIRADVERVKIAKAHPRLIIIDYMDLLATESYKNDFRNSQYELWKEMRGFAQEQNCLIIAATQANAASYKTDLLDESNFSEDKRKNGLITALFGLNQTPIEKERGIMRVNTILAREGYFDKRRTVSVLQCLQMGQPVLGSFDT